MERFRPDSLLDGLFRPFLLADPSGYVYIEMLAPDFRFAIATTLAIVLVLSRKSFSLWTTTQRRVPLALAICFYVWTYVSGNGRYFLPGLLLVGPVLILLIKSLPASRAMRCSLVGLAAAVQVYMIMDVYQGDPWRVSQWHDGAAIGLAESPIRREPALFLKIGANSYSGLTPHFHPDSRWIMLGNHLRRVHGSYERVKLDNAFASGLRAYAFAPMANEIADSQRQPVPDIRRSINDVLAEYGFALNNETCSVIEVNMNPATPEPDSRLGTAEGFWACPIRKVGDISQDSAAGVVLPESHQRIFSQIEQACPRFFPPNSGLDTHFDGVSRRYYQATDIRLQMWTDGPVAYQYLRSPGFTKIGTEQQVSRREVEVPCGRFVGRYRPPWGADR